MSLGLIHACIASQVPVVYPCALSPEPETSRGFRSATPPSTFTTSRPDHAARRLSGGTDELDSGVSSANQNESEESSDGISFSSQSDPHSVVGHSSIDMTDLPQGIDLECLLSREPTLDSNPLSFLASDVEIQAKKRGKRNSSTAKGSRRSKVCLTALSTIVSMLNVILGYHSSWRFIIGPSHSCLRRVPLDVHCRFRVILTFAYLLAHTTSSSSLIVRF